MSWIRLHDGFTSNPKIAGLSDSEFRLWIRVLCHCARAKDPTVDAAVRAEVGGLTDAKIRHLFALGLLDRIGADYEVHDWAQYQPKDSTGADRQARWRARRKAALNGHPPVTPPVTEGVT